MAHLKEEHLIDAPLEIDASYDGLDLLVELKYRGRAPHFGAAERGHETAHEEAAVSADSRASAPAPMPTVPAFQSTAMR